MSERELLFPEDLTVGWIAIGRGEEWLADLPARGRVRVPPGAAVHLAPFAPVRGLASLAPDALHAVRMQKRTTTDGDLQRIGHLAGLHALRCSKAPAVTDAGVAHLSGLRALRDLDLYATSVADAGLAPLARMAHLRHLHLGMTRVLGPGLRMLVGLQRLEWLSLEETDVDDTVVPHVAAMRALKTIAVWGTRLSTRGVAELARALPEARIVIHETGHRLARERALRAVLSILVRRIAPTSAAGVDPRQALARLLPPGTRLGWSAPGFALRPLAVPPEQVSVLASCLSRLPAGSTLRFVTPDGREVWIPWLRRRLAGRRASDARRGGRRTGDLSSAQAVTFH
jgi:hypothetical protein